MKQLELAHIKNKLSHPSVPKVYTEKKEWKPRRRIKSSVIESDRIHVKVDKSIDFLAERRNKRDMLEQAGVYPKMKNHLMMDDIEKLGTGTEKLIEVKNRADRMDKVIGFKQKMLNNTAPISAQALEVSEEVNGAILGSIKAKLKVLNEP